jgi:hypothetical protein
MSRTETVVLSPVSAAANPWIAAELGKGIDGERALSSEAKARAGSPPDPSLSVLYNEIAAADLRHATIVERVAVRYGLTPAGTATGGGIGETLGQIKDRFSNLGSAPHDYLAMDLQAKCRSVHWLTAWSAALEKMGDSTSAQELAAVLKEEHSHHDALQQAYNWLIERQASGSGDTGAN